MDGPLEMERGEIHCGGTEERTTLMARGSEEEEDPEEGGLEMKE